MKNKKYFLNILSESSSNFHLYEKKKIIIKNILNSILYFKRLLIFIITYILLFIFLSLLLKERKYKLNYISKIEKRFNLSIEFNKIYSDLYFAAKYGKINKPIFTSIKNKKFPIKKNKGICLCAIGKNENVYAKEFVEYYLFLGFNKIIIFDNNKINEEKFEDVLKDFILKKFVEIIDIRGLMSVQIPVYNYCYQKYKDLFDWIAFFDFDEYLYIKNNANINDYLYSKRFEKCQSILFNWYMYNDNNLEKYDNRKLIERFKNVSLKLSRVKSIIRGNIKNLLIPSSHISGININYFCNSNGKQIFPKSFRDIKLSIKNYAYIKHYYTKTAEEFCHKINRDDVQFNPKKSIIISKLRDFFFYNKMTKSKIKILKKCVKINFNKYIKKNINNRNFI